MTEALIEPAIAAPPNAFTLEQIGWTPWLAPLPEAELTEHHRAALVDPARAKSAYFMLLARDPDILAARTRTDKDIFYNTTDGLPRDARELAATAVSRVNGCIFCASVHARFAVHLSKQPEAVRRLLERGLSAPLDQRWSAIAAAAGALTQTPPAFDAGHVVRLRDAGLDDGEIADVIHAAAFFNWANRLMLSLGEPTPAP
ncbi:alkylhydroperoxidase domain protein [Xanthobacter sp. V4C-4]|uniref:alkylhydroperoxidase domain protein n=1 Tax=Xanthobacter cornucopiae TaxID=3119924 RepID=UPI00372C0B0C